MRYFAYTCFLFLLTVSLRSQKPYSLPAHVSSADYLPNTIIVKVDPSFRSSCSEQGIANDAFAKTASALQINTIVKKFKGEQPPREAYNAQKQSYVDLSLVYELHYNSQAPIDKVINALLKTGLFLYAEPHFVPKPDYAPNDPLANPTDQYHLQTINAFNAWNVSKGDSSIVIGITDTGTDPTHNDLFNSIKRNLNDPIDMIDNDGDGYVDNYMGWDVAMNDNDPTYQGNAHGVHVCGIAGATADNNLGGAGVGFYCKILPVKIADASGNLVAAYEGIKYAADHGCTVINCSWGGGGSSQYGQDVVNYATINKNCLVVAAAGNNASNAEFYPAAFDNVFAIANTNSTDQLSASSDFGYFVDVCAPGENINSTWPGNFYTTLTGTSMSSPCTAGAAALIKQQFPSYNGLQLAERLRVTADNIYPSNPSFVNQLGTGRINLYRALTDPAVPSVTFSNRMVTDHNDGIFINGDSLFITGLFTNYLAPTVALGATLTPLSSYVSVVDNTTSLGVIPTMGTATNNSDAFSFKLSGSIPVNQGADFQLILQDGAYQSSTFFTVYLNTDYINIPVNSVYTTATSKGKIGYNMDSQSQGLGFKYNGDDILYEAGLMIGADTNRVSDCVRGNNPNVADVDFSAINVIQKVVPAVTSDFDTDGSIHDNLASVPMNVDVHQKTFAWIAAPYNKFVIWEYTIKNTNASDTLKNLYAGVFADWDIDGATFAQNRSAYDATTKLGYSYYTAANGTYAGIRLLTSSAGANFYGIDNVSGGNGGVDLTNGFSTPEKYTTLSTPRLNAGVGGSGNDIINVMSSGPITLLPNQSIVVAFALIAGDSLSDLENSGNMAQIKYNGLPTAALPVSNENAVRVYPNPSHDRVTVQLQQAAHTTIRIMNLSGVLVKEFQMETLQADIDLHDVAEGVYLLQADSPHLHFTRKLVRLK